MKGYQLQPGLDIVLEWEASLDCFRNLGVGMVRFATRSGFSTYFIVSVWGRNGAVW
jgi:hypothetical protein